MIVCICKNVNTAQITQSIQGGARSIDEVRTKTGASSCCGSCLFKVNRLIDEQVEPQQPSFYDASATA